MNRGSVVGFALFTAMGMAACATGPASTPVPAPIAPAAASPPANLPTWMIGHWVREDGTGSETWVAAGPALLGVGFTTTDARTSWFEVLIITEVDGVLTYTALPGGQKAVDFAVADSGPESVGFANLAHDHPQRIRYRRRGDTLLAELESARGGSELWTWQRAEPAPAASPAASVNEADRRFAADSAARGAEAWAAVFAADGVKWQRGRPPLVGPDAIRESMQRAFSDPEVVFTWEPHTSALSPAGDLGFTAGRYRLVRRSAGGPVEEGSGTYLTIWRRQADGTWQVVFDTGVSGPVS
jgi:ketosteroid isomerase-like protein